ncbi:hypothetical protein ACOMHN_048948 [Nucella lapillus]
MLLVLLLSQCLVGALAMNNGLARTPPMGWLSWERFRCETDCVNYPDSCVNDKLYMAMADRIVADGYKDAGYEYVHIDDCWAARERDSEGKLQADPKRFPGGIKAVADYVHERGLKLGIYTDIGFMTCQKYPGSAFHMESDANSFAEWGVDLVKTDGCYSNIGETDYAFPAFSFYLNKTGRPMVLCCQWPAPQMGHHVKPNWTLVREYCNTWRSYGDIQDSWDRLKQIIDYYGQNLDDFASHSAPGGFADPDQLIVGNFGLSHSQQRVQFGMWAMLTAPLLMSVDLRTIPPQSRDILLNRHVIAINQDPLGTQGVLLYGFKDSISVWMKPLSAKDSHAIAFVNYDDRGRPSPFSLHLGDIGLANPNGYNVTEVFDNRNMGLYKTSANLTLSINPTDIVLLKVVPL